MYESRSGEFFPLFGGEFALGQNMRKGNDSGSEPREEAEYGFDISNESVFGGRFFSCR
jgi:hypothetical protein